MPAFIVYSCADRNTVRSLLSIIKLIAIAQARFLHDVLESMLLERFHLTSTVCVQCIRALVVHEIYTCESPLPNTRYRSCGAASLQRVQISCTLSSPALHA